MLMTRPIYKTSNLYSANDKNLLLAFRFHSSYIHQKQAYYLAVVSLFLM